MADPRNRETARSRIALSLLLAVVLAVGVLAAFYRGVPLSQVSLNDGGVWVTNKALSLVAHLNYPSKRLDGGLVAPSDAFDLHQNGNDVVVKDFTDKAAAPVDVAALSLGASGTFPSTATVSYGGDVAAVIDPTAGRVWALPATDVGSFSKASKPLVDKSPGIQGVVDSAGDILLVASDGSLQTWRQLNGGWTRQDAGHLADYSPTAKSTFAAVGDRLVALDLDEHAVHTPSAIVVLPASDGLVLQDSGPASDKVVVASPTALLYAPMSGGQVTSRDASTSGNAVSGTPAPPVNFDGCVYAGWAGSGAYIRDCPNAPDDIARTVPKLAAMKELRFRTNRNVIVLNDVASGTVLLVDQNMQEVDNWQQIKNDLDQQQKSSQQQSDSVDNLAAPASPKQNHAPIAKPDAFGVRAGQTNWLPVLANDVDVDGDVLTATVDDQPKLGPVSAISQGEALQVAVPAGATGSDSFSYTASDGRGGSSKAPVRLTVHPWSQNEAPKPLRQTSLTIAQGGSVTYNVLPDWYDPDGDMVYLRSASPVAGTSVDFRPDGTVTIRDLGSAEAGIREIPIHMTDGRLDAQGVLRLVVKPGNQNLPPVANSDHVIVVVGRTVVAQPLANDTDPNGDSLRLTDVSKQTGLTVTPDYVAGTITLTATKPGSSYLTYHVSDGRAQSAGLIRVDAIAPDAKGQPPAAVADLALVPANGSALVDLTANDTDPMGGVLVVQSISVDRASGLSVQLIDHHLARVSAPSGLTGSASFAYTVSNGYGTATTEVKVLPLPNQGTDKPPVAINDAATVRAGDIVTVDVLANDISPAELPLTLDPKVTLDGGDGGIAFTSANMLRFRAGPKGGTVRATYTVRDSEGGFASATVTFTVVALTDANDPPKPLPITARTFAGTPVRIPIPTSGVDPDGDSVTISGLAAPVPTLGAVTIGDGYLEYTPSATASGTDTFAYTVADRFGASGAGVVSVGVAPAPTVNQAPYAVADSVSVRPGRVLSVPVTANDVDPDGDPLTLVDGSVKPVDSTTTTPVTVRDNRVDLTTPATEGVLRYYYDVSDGRGGLGRGSLTITVSKNAPLLYPIARDDVVSEEQAFGQTAVTVDVLANDEDPDGSTKALTLASTDPGVTVTADQKLRIPITPQRQVIVYSITDPDHQTARAVVMVPGSNDQVPVLDPSKVPAQVKAGEQLTIKLSDYVKVRPGHTPRITFAETVKAAGGANGDPLVKDATTLVFTSTKDFTGLTSITFEVTDGTSPKDPQGLKSVLSLPINVLPNPKLQNKPPVVHPSQVTVAAGEKATTVDLAAMAKDPDPGDTLRYRLSGATQPFKVSLNGSQLTVSAPVDAKPGTPGTATIQVSDGVNPAVTAAIPLQVVSSTRPLLTIAPISITDANAGKPSTVDLAANVTNPFAADGKPVHLVGQPAVTVGQGSVRVSGLTLTITPNTGFHGQMVVQFRLGDATNDPTREVSGTASVTVRDRPAAPTNVHAVTTVSKSADVSWAAGANNGAPITGFTVRWTGADGSSGQQTVGQVTSLSLHSLTNNVYYTFTVVATNIVGDSDPSKPSNKVRPDTKPNQVGQPTGTFGDQQVTVSWPQGTTDGAPIASYSVTISPAAGGIATKDGVKGTSLVWTGLTNGTSYTFSVVAVSTNNLSSDPSGSSAPVVPAGAPLQPAAPHVVKDPASNLEPSVTVSWTPPNGNGDDNMTYEMRESGTSAVLYSGTGTSAHASVPVSSTNQTFEVRATNKSAKWSPWSPVSNAIRPFQPPGAVQGLSITPTGSNNTVHFNFTPGPLNGAQPSEVTYYWRSSTGASGVTSPGGTVTSGPGFPNGSTVSVQVWAESSVNGETASGPSGSASVNAYGPPHAPAVDARGNVNNVTLTWDGSGSPNGRPITAVQVQTTDGTWTEPVSGSLAEGNGRNQTKCISARAQDNEGHWGDWSGQRCASTWGSASYHFTNSWQVAPTPSGATGTWYYVTLTLNLYNPGSVVSCSVPGVNAVSWTFSTGVDGNGSFSAVGPRGNTGRLVGTAAYISDSMGSCG